jgi:bifunctional non-homologous end joining protein LigD
MAAGAMTVSAVPRKLVRPTAARKRSLAAPGRRRLLFIPDDLTEAPIKIGGRSVRLTNLQKPFWPDLGVTKRDLLQYYADVASLLLPHLVDRAMVMKRYPDGAAGKFFFMKRAPTPRPEWIRVCSIPHRSGNVIDFPVVGDLASLLWIVNLGCIDLNPWYDRCGNVDRPDYLHFDLDPVPPAEFARVREAALIVREALQELGMRSLAKTSGSRGMHVYVPIQRGPIQKDVWRFAKSLAQEIAARRPDILTAEYRIVRRPAGRILVDYNQNAWGRTLASTYSVRPRPRATVSTPVTWDEIGRGIEPEDFRIDNVRERFARLGDLWKPLLSARGRCRLKD